MPYTVTVERKAANFLRDLTDKRLALRLREAIDALAENPRAPGSVKLPGEGELYRARVGDYRIVSDSRCGARGARGANRPSPGNLPAVVTGTGSYTDTSAPLPSRRFYKVTPIP